MRRLLVVLCIVCCAIFAFGLTACGKDKSPTTDQQDNGIIALYNMYVGYAKENGMTVLSYEDWILSIKGEKGDKGDSGATIAKIEFDEYNRLIVTLTSGEVLDPIELPQKEEHIHDYSKWIDYTNDSTILCENRLGYRFCADCDHVEWVKGVDHIACDDYESFAEYHYKRCSTCTKILFKEDHKFDGNSSCSICGYTVQVTAINQLIYTTYANGIVIVNTASNASTTVLRIVENYIIGQYKISNVLMVSGNNFRNNSELVIVDINCDGIDTAAFYNCSKLKYLIIGKDVTQIGDQAFSLCSNLLSIVYKGTIEEWNAITKGNNWSQGITATKVICSNGEVFLG